MMKRNNIDDEPWAACAHDFGSPLIRNMIWTKSMRGYKRVHKLDVPVFGIISEKNKIAYLFKQSTWKRAHEQMAERVRKDVTLIRRLIIRTEELGKEKCIFTKKVFEMDLSIKSAEELMGYLMKFAELQEEVYTFGTAIPLLDFLDLNFIEDNIRGFMDSRLSKEKVDEYFHALTVPTEDSFAMEQEKELLRLWAKYYSKELNDSILSDDVIQDLFLRELQQHTKKYCWVYYVYSGPVFGKDDFLDFIKDYIKKGIHPVNELERLRKAKEELIIKKEEIINELQPDDFHEELMRVAGSVVWAKPRRKDYQTLSYYHIFEGLLVEVARRLGLTKEQILSAPYADIENGLNSGKIDVGKLNAIYEYHAVYPEGDKFVVVWGDKAREFADNVLLPNAQADTDVDELKGTTACPGYAKGKVKIVNSPADMGKMEDGDILISTATTPSIVSAMKKAAAIVTDEGGLTCHASIVSREMGTPCVVGTKIVTSVFKDGDIVEVDAGKGVVRKL